MLSRNAGQANYIVKEVEEVHETSSFEIRTDASEHLNTNLAYATVVAAISIFVLRFSNSRGLLIAGVPIFLGVLSMWLCVMASGRTKRRTGVFAYALLLAPFAFYYPYVIALMILQTPQMMQTTAS